MIYDACAYKLLAGCARVRVCVSKVLDSIPSSVRYSLPLAACMQSSFDYSSRNPKLLHTFLIDAGERQE
jgi:hypothetical protein